MDPARVEELLGRRAAHLRDEAASRAAYGAVLRERARLRWRRRGVGLALAAAALLAVVFLWRPLSTAPRPAPTFTLALLDDAGRDLALGGVVRGGPERPPFPARVLIEVVAEADGHARVVLFDATGAPHEAEAELTAGRAALVPLDLGAGVPGDAGGELDWVVLTAAERELLERLELPQVALPPAGEERRAALEALVARLAAQPHVAVEARHLDVEAAE